MKFSIAIATVGFLTIGSANLARSGGQNEVGQAAHRTGPFILGADISWVQEDEAEGSTYYDHGVKKDVFQIFKDNGFNFIRLRVFVNPAAPRGYAARSKEAFCDAAHTLTMAKRVRAAGMGLLIDFHYSDTWADPGKQFKPAAWENLDMPALKKALYDHTYSVLSALKKQGTTPDMVQIGNEVTNGFLWPDGRAKDHFDNFAEIIKSGIAAARAVDPAIKIVLHHDKGNNNAVVRWWLDNLISRGVKFDIIGLSCNTDGPAEKWRANFDDLAVRYPQYALLAAEYSYRKRELNDVVYNVPDRRGLGSFIWEPTRHHEAIFDRDGRNAGAGTQRPPRAAAPPAQKPPAAPAHRPRTGRFDTNDLIDLYPQMAKDYGNAAARESPTKQITNSIGMKLTLVPSGEFMMGSEESAGETAEFFKKTFGFDYPTAEHFKDEHPQHRVRITRPFYLGTYHVTRGQFRQFVKQSGYKTDAEKGENRGGFGWDSDQGEFYTNEKYSWRNAGFDQSDEHPVVNVSWNDAVAFCQWLSKKEGKTYRLPTEADWEYACRAGTKTRYYNGDDPEALAKIGNVADAAYKANFPFFNGAIKAKDGYVFTAPVGKFKPNAFGLYDMHGNAWHWCADWHGEDYYGKSPVDDPAGPDTGAARVTRGGSWNSWPHECGSAARDDFSQDSESCDIGFRVAITTQ